MTARRWAATLLVALLLVLAIGPFLVPVPPLTDTVPPPALADADSRFVTLGGIDVHYKTRGDDGPEAEDRTNKRDSTPEFRQEAFCNIPHRWKSGRLRRGSGL